MSQVPLRVRPFLAVAMAFSIALVLTVLLVSGGRFDGLPSYVAPVVAALWLTTLAVCWLAMRAGRARPMSVSQKAFWSGASPGQVLAKDNIERELLMREVHHRVKNNLQMISSLLSLQAERIRSPRIRRIFGRAQNRVLAMALVHRQLYERANWAEVDFQSFFNDIVRHLAADHGAHRGADVRFYIGGPTVATGPDIAIPVGLIVCEAVSNALTHAFANTPDPRVSVRLQMNGETGDLRIEDNGVSEMPVRPMSVDRGGLGFTLLRGLTAQLGGRLDISRRPEGGTCVHVTFPDTRHLEARDRK